MGQVIDMWLAAGIIGVMAFLAWLWLLLFRGDFWRMSLRLGTQKNREIAVSNHPDTWPSVCAIVPARNEADMLPKTLPALLEQSYDGPFSVILVDDHSEDGTAEIARKIAQASGHPERLTIISADALPPGFVGKVWAQQCGLQHAPHDAEFILFTDADILHPAHSVESLVRKALLHPSDLVSLMVRLRIESFWETLLIPAFVYFFAKLYPFRWVCSPHRQTAAAAGGSILVRHKLVRQDGGLAPIGGALIDDCSLAQLIQSRNGSLWLGLGDDVTSLRAYPKLTDIWNMVARSAFVQLHYSTWLLIGTVAGMLVLYACPVIFGIASVCLLGTSTVHVVGWSIAAATNLCAWLLMSISFLPMLRWYKVDLWKAALLPLDGFLYTLMTIDSARRFWRGHTDAWKGRPYQRSEPAGWKSR